MNGYDLLGKAMRGEIEEGQEFETTIWVGEVIYYKQFIKFDRQCFEWVKPFEGNTVTWTIERLNQKYDKVKDKPQLDEWEKETCKRLLTKGYKWITRDEDGQLFADIEKQIKDTDWGWWAGCEDKEFVKLFDGFNFITWADEEPTLIEWLLE